MKRIIQIDALRGFMLVNMTIDHLLYEPFHSIDVILDYSCQSFGFVSAAEGFYFLSGLVAGMVFGGMLIKGQLDEMRTRAYKRAKEIYLTNIALFVIMTLSVLVFKNVLHLGGHISSDMLIFNEPLTALGLGVILLNLPYLFEILPLYFFFLLITPLVITQTAKGRTGWVLSGAVVIWVLAQLGLRNGIEGLLNSFMPANLGHFDIFAWQFLFVTGLVIGFHKRKGTLPGFLVKPSKSLTAIVAVMAALIFADRYGLFGFFGLTFVGYPTSITLLGPVRILDFALLGYLIFGLAGKYKEWFEIRWLAFLGQHSLYVFAYHVLLCYGLKLFQDRITAMSLAPKLIFFALVIASLTIPAWVHQRIRTWYRESRAAGKITPVPPSVNAA